MRIERVRAVLDALGATYALIGAHAMAVRGYPRFTVDVDLLTADDRVLQPDIWKALAAEGARIDPRRGDGDDPLAGVVHILLTDGTDVDLVVAKWRWEADLIERAEPVVVNGHPIRVPPTSDLILLKLAAGGFADLQDAAALLALHDPDATARDVEAHLAEVRPDVRAVWQDLVSRRQR
jgi:hypothetical protein